MNLILPIIFIIFYFLLLAYGIVHENESLGVIVVDNLTSKRNFREGDINLLMAVASQTALSITNARSFQKLQESEKKHRTLVETLRDIVYSVDLKGRITYISPMVTTTTGFIEKELLGRHFVEIVNHPFKELIFRKFSHERQSNETSTYEIEILSKNKEVVPVELNIAPLTDNKGNLVGRIGVVRDITRRILTETQRKEMELRAHAQDKLASLGEIATGIAHEINQPLTYIKIILQATLNDIEADDNDINEQVLSDDFNESLRQVTKISKIISHLRTFGRSDVTTFDQVKLDKVLDDTLILMKERLRIRNINFLMEIPENFPLLYGNHIKMEQVFVNLIQNSMDAMERNREGEIVLKALEGKNEAQIIYSDNGEGVDPMLQEKIFEPFFTTKEAGKGTGIGLSIVLGIIKEHNGYITCESEKGKGTIFKINLPFYQDDAVASSALELHA